MAIEAAATPPERGGKTRLVSMSDLDRRTKAAQTAVATKIAIIADLGGEQNLSTLERLQAENAAMGAAVLRDMQVRWLQGEESRSLTCSRSRTPSTELRLLSAPSVGQRMSRP